MTTDTFVQKTKTSLFTSNNMITLHKRINIYGDRLLNQSLLLLQNLYQIINILVSFYNHESPSVNLKYEFAFKYYISSKTVYCSQTCIPNVYRSTLTHMWTLSKRPWVSTEVSRIFWLRSVSPSLWNGLPAVIMISSSFRNLMS